MKVTLKDVRQFIKPGRVEFFLSIVLSIADVICVSYYPYLLSLIIDNYKNMLYKNVYWIISTFIFSIIMILVVQYLNKIVKNRYEKKIKTKLREKLFSSILESHYEDFNKKRIEDYSSLILNEVNDVYTLFFENLIYNVNSIIKLITYTIVLLFFSWQMCIVIMGSLVFVAMLPFITGKKFDYYSKNFADSRANYISHIEEYLNAFILYDRNNIGYFEKLHDNFLLDLQSKRLSLADYRSGVQIISGASLYIQLIICFVIGIIFTLNNIISFGVFASSLVYVEYVSSYSSNIVDEILEIKSSKEFLNRILKVLNLESKLEKKKNLYFSNEDKISISNVSYRIDDKILLRPISLTFDLNKKYLITGDNGSGKSTLLKIIVGLLNPSTGRIIYPKKIYDHNKLISYIPQDRYLFEGTILENILLFETPTDQGVKEIKKICKSINLNLDLNYKVRKSGINLSGGEKAKICLIRGLLNKKEIFVIDEPLNDVDISSQRDILHILDKFNKTLIVVGHGMKKDIFDEIIYIKV